jgi:RNA polymerase primary sigma factor
MMITAEGSPTRTIEAQAEVAEVWDGVGSPDLFRLFSNDVGRRPLLSLEEERDLLERFERGRFAREELEKGEVGFQTRSEIELEELVGVGGAAMEKLVESNFGLVVSVAKRYVGRGVAFADLLQEGNLGLMKGIEKFDLTKPYRLSTYATWWIRQYTSRAVAEQGRAVKVPVWKVDALRRLKRERTKLELTLGRDPSAEELRRELRWTEARFKKVLEVEPLPDSLDRPVRVGGRTLGESIEDGRIPVEEGVMARVSAEDMAVGVRGALAALPPRQGEVLQLMFGFGGGKCHTLREIGARLNLSPEGVRLVKKQAFERLGESKDFCRLRDLLE